MPRTTWCRLLPLFSILAGIAANPIGGETLVVANKSDDTIDLVDLATGRSGATLPTGHAPHEVVVSPDGTRAVISNYGDRDTPGSSLTVIDIPQAAVVSTIELNRHTYPHGLAWLHDNEIAVTTEGSGHLLVVDVGTGQISRQIPTGQDVSHMVAVTPDKLRAFVANIGSGTVTAIDVVTGSKLADIATGAGAEGIAVTPDGHEVWVGNRGADTLSIIDPLNLRVVASLACPGFPIRVTVMPEGDQVLVSAARSGEIVVFDSVKRREILRRQLDLENASDASRRLFGDQFGDSPVPVGLVAHPSRDYVWVAATQADAVIVIRPQELEVQSVLRAGHEPDGMAYSQATVKVDLGSSGP